MKITTKPRTEDLSDKKSARLFITVYVDGLQINEVLVASGPKADIDDLAAGDIMLTDLRNKWSKDPPDTDPAAQPETPAS